MHIWFTIVAVGIFVMSILCLWLLREIKETGIQTHLLVNSNMQIQLAERLLLARNNKAMAERLAHLSGTTEDAGASEQAAEALTVAQSIYASHMAKQAKVDERVSANAAS